MTCKITAIQYSLIKSTVNLWASMISNKLPFSITGLIQLSFFITQVKYFNKRYEWACNLTASALREFIDMTAIKVTVIDFGFVFDLHGYYLAANHCLEPDNHAALFQGVYKDSCINYREKIMASFVTQWWKPILPQSEFCTWRKLNPLVLVTSALTDAKT